LGSVALAACGSSSPVDVIVEPGITAIDQSSALACDADLLSLQNAMEYFALLNAGPPTAESDLVPDWLRSESEFYDLVDGVIVPATGSDCPTPSADTPSAPPATADIPASTRQCLADSKMLQVAIEAYYAFNGRNTVPTEQALVDAQLLRVLDDAYDVDATGQVVAVPGGTCDGVEPDTTTTTATTTT
jgi:hypothetical protein